VPRRKHPASAILALLFLAVGTFVLFLERDPGVKKFSVAQTADLLARDTTVVLIDVRTVEEWNGESGHLRGARLIPLTDLQKRLPEFDQYRARQLVIYCRSGNRSGKAARLLMDHGFGAISMAGGIRQWHAAAYPVVKEPQQ
jgi:rhodanese-related sulfurtransferase